MDNKITELLNLISINRQLILYNDGYDKILPYSGKVVVKKGNIYYKVILDDAIKYFIDKKTNKVYNFYKRYIGDAKDISNKLKIQINNYPKKYKFNPKVKLSFTNIVKEKGYLGKVFVNTWGYDMTINDFVQVVSETPKQVKVRKLKVQKISDKYNQQGSERPLKNNFSSKEFTLIKDSFRGALILRGRNKADDRYQSVTWTLMNRETIPFNYID